MNGFSPKSVYTVAKKEFLDNVRNKWIVLLTIIFVILIIVFSYVAGAGQDTFGNLQNTVTGLMSIASLLIPIIAIILGFSTIAGESESGALYVVLSYPVRRIEVLLGKFFGLGLVIAFSVFLGFGIGGIIIAATTGYDALGGYIGFILLTILLGWIYLSLAILASAVSKTRARAIGLGILVFFWAMIYSTVIMAILLATGYDLGKFFAGQITYPDWVLNSVIFSPSDAYQTATYRAFGQNTFTFGQIVVSIPELLSLSFLLLVLILWFAVPLLLAYYFFKKRDI